MNLSKNFTLAELTRSQTATRKGIRNTPNEVEVAALRELAINILQPVRDHFDLPVRISSGYRSVMLCVAIGSKTSSQHARGEAADFEVPGVANIEVARWIEKELVFDQLILEFYKPEVPDSGWIHCSYKKGPCRKQVLTFDGKSYKLRTFQE